MHRLKTTTVRNTVKGNNPAAMWPPATPLATPNLLAAFKLQNMESFFYQSFSINQAYKWTPSINNKPIPNS